MVLGFKTYFPWGEPTFFKEKILLSCKQLGFSQELSDVCDQFYLFPKLHTIRKGNRIKPGTLLHMATGVRSKNYFRFNTDIPELHFCKSVQSVVLNAEEKNIWIGNADNDKLILLSEMAHDVFAVNDGFRDAEQFWLWFTDECKEGDFVGQLIHWTDVKYNKL